MGSSPSRGISSGTETICYGSLPLLSTNRQAPQNIKSAVVWFTWPFASSRTASFYPVQSKRWAANRGFPVDLFVWCRCISRNGKPVSNRDLTSSRCTDNQTQYQMHGAVRKRHGKIEQWSATLQLFFLAKNLLSHPPLKEMGRVFAPAKTEAKRKASNRFPCCHRHEMTNHCHHEIMPCLPVVALWWKEETFPLPFPRCTPVAVPRPVAKDSSGIHAVSMRWVLVLARSLHPASAPLLLAQVAKPQLLCSLSNKASTTKEKSTYR